MENANSNSSPNSNVSSVVALVPVDDQNQNLGASKTVDVQNNVSENNNLLGDALDLSESENNNQQNHVNDLKRKYLSDITPQVNQSKKRCLNDSTDQINYQLIQNAARNFAQSTPKTYSRITDASSTRPTVTLEVSTCSLSPVQPSQPKVIYTTSKDATDATFNNSLDVIGTNQNTSSTLTKTTTLNPQGQKIVRITSSPQTNDQVNNQQKVAPPQQANKPNQSTINQIIISPVNANNNVSKTTRSVTIPTAISVANTQAQNLNRQLVQIGSSSIPLNYCLLNSQSSPISYVQFPSVGQSNGNQRTNQIASQNRATVDYPLILSPVTQFTNSQPNRATGIRPISHPIIYQTNRPKSPERPKTIIDPNYARLKQEIEDSQNYRSREILFLETLEEKLGDRNFFDLKKLVVPDLQPNCSRLDYGKWLDAIVFNVLEVKDNPNEKDITAICSYLCGQRNFLLTLYEEHDKWSGIEILKKKLRNKVRYRRSLIKKSQMESLVDQSQNSSGIVTSTDQSESSSGLAASIDQSQNSCDLDFSFGLD